MRKTALFLSLCVFISTIAGCGAQKQETPETVTEAVEEAVESGDTKIITDMRGKEVEIPQDPERVAILDKGFLVQTMRALGVTDRICHWRPDHRSRRSGGTGQSLSVPGDYGTAYHRVSHGCCGF